MKRSALLLLPGMLFGIGLGISGMTNPAKVLGFLDLAGRWDPSLALVMAGAVLSFGALRLLVLRRSAPLFGGGFPALSRESLDPRLIGGSALFGLGWGLGGLCPGPALTNLGGLRPSVFLFVAAMAAGSVLAQQLFRADE